MTIPDQMMCFIRQSSVTSEVGCKIVVQQTRCGLLVSIRRLGTCILKETASHGILKTTKEDEVVDKATERSIYHNYHRCCL